MMQMNAAAAGVPAAGAVGFAASSMQLQLLACTVGVLLWAALPTAMASAADLLKAGDAAYSSGNYNRYGIGRHDKARQKAVCDGASHVGQLHVASFVLVCCSQALSWGVLPMLKTAVQHKAR